VLSTVGVPFCWILLLSGVSICVEAMQVVVITAAWLSGSPDREIYLLFTFSSLLNVAVVGLVSWYCELLLCGFRDCGWVPKCFYHVNFDCTASRLHQDCPVRLKAVRSYRLKMRLIRARLSNRYLSMSSLPNSYPLPRT
jgi:hypothetical protein